MFEKLKNKFVTAPVDDMAVFNARHRAHNRSSDSEQLVLDYLKRFEGERINYDDVAIDLGFTGGYVSLLITKLMKSKAVTRKGKRGSHTFVVNRRKAKRRAYNKRKSVPVKAVASKPTVELRKSSPATPKMSDEVEKRVYDYLSKHQHEFISQAEISQGTNTSQSGVSFAVRALEENGLICRSVPVPHLGTQYRILDPNAAEVKVVTTPTHTPTEKVLTSDERLIRDFLEYQRQRKA